MSKYQRQIARILKKWAATPTTTAEDLAKQNRWPAGAPSSKGGQFAPAKGGGGGTGSGKAGSGAVQYTSYASLFGPDSTFPGGESPKWAGQQNAKPPAPPPGAKPHLKPNDKGEAVTVNYPTKPSDKASWTDPSRTATFVPGGDAPAVLNGVPMKPWASVPKSESEWANVPGQKLSLDARFPFEPMPGKSSGAGVIIREPDGRMWLTKPTNAFGGYQQTFPKGTVEHGLSMQASAIKETWEETGLQIKITGILGDYERTTSKARFYVAERIGGTPADMGWESQAVRLAARKDLDKLLNMGVDKGILADLDEEGFFDKAAKPAGKTGSWMKQERWPGGTPLGGQWKTMDGDGVTMPPKIAGGLTGSNSQYQKKADAAYAAAKAGNKTLVLDTAITLQKKVTENEAKGASSSHAKWTAQLSQFVTQVASDIFAAPKVQAIAERLSGITKLSAWTGIGGKPGGSNPGGMYQDASGQKWLVKGNAQYTNGAVGGTTSDDRAKNEVLAARLMQAVGVGAPDMKLIDLEGKHGGAKEGVGSTGVASKWVDGGKSFNANDPAHLKAAQADFAVHAWLGNYDVMGMGFDNTVIVGGKAVNIDPGGAILFRAQGLPKDSFGKDASEWETMRKTSPEQKAVYGAMTKSDLQASASKLAAVTDDTIKELVKTHGPGDEKARQELASTLIARRDAILAKAGVMKDGTLTGKAAAPAAVAPAPVSEPPKVTQADTPAKPVPGLTKPSFDDSFGKAGYYDGMAQKMLDAHAAGDMAALKAAGQNSKGSKAWPTNTTNGKLMAPFHAGLIADLEKQQDTAAQALAAGKATITGTDGKTWVDDGKGVLQPTAGPKVSDTTIQAMMDDVVESQKLGPMKLAMVDPIGPTGKLIAAAKAGDIDGVMNAKGAGAYFTGLKEKLVEAFSSAASQTTAPALKPAKVKMSVIESVVAQVFDGNATVTEFLSSNASGDKNIQSMIMAAATGDAAALQAASGSSGYEGKLKQGLLAAMAAPPQARVTKPVVATPQPVPQPAPKVPTGAPPNFAKALLPDTNTNAGPHNGKISQIQTLFEAGDEKGILALKLGTNTYAKKQVQVANDALAALGSVHQVTVGQKANAHPALSGSATQAAQANAEGKPTPAATPKAAAPVATPIYKIPNAPDFANWKGAGIGLSSFAPFNAQNTELANTIKSLGDKLDVEGLKTLKYQPIDQNGAPAGDLKLVSQHKSQHIPKYLEDVLYATQNPYIPPKLMTRDELKAIPDAVKAIVSKVADVASYAEASKKIGRYAALGMATDAKATFDGFPPKQVTAKNKTLGIQSLYDESNAKFGKLTSIEQQAIKDYTGGSYKSMNSYGSGSLSALGDTAAQGIRKAAVTLPTGTVVSRKFTFNTDHASNVKQLEAQIGGVIKDFGIISTSTNPQVWSGDVHLHITTAPGVKGLYVAPNPKTGKPNSAISVNPGENEIILPFGTKFYVKSVKKGGKKDDAGSWGTEVGASYVVELIALPDLSTEE